MLIDSVRCEVLNASYEFLTPVSGRRALNLVLQGKAAILSSHPTAEVVSANDIWPVPTQICLKYMVKARFSRATPILTRQRLLVRDMYTCQYCLRHKMDLKEGEFLTRDHVFPVSKGGLDTWTNVATACNRCNNKKANHECHEIDMFPRKAPYAPSVHELRSKAIYKKKRPI
jgi:5-methylcytosine-specific restriction endonuclease McrA